MKKIVILFLFIFFCLSAGCGGSYLIKLKNGEAYETSSQPKMNEEEDFMTVETSDGKKIYINKDEILVIEQK